MTRQARKLVWAAAAVAAIVLGVPFYIYGIDALSVGLSGGRTPNASLYLRTAASNGITELDPILNATAEAKGLKVSRGKFCYAGNCNYPRELWRPGASIMLTNEMMCTGPEGGDVQNSRRSFALHLTQMSFLTSKAYLRDVEADLRHRLRASGRIAILPKQVCPPPDDA